MPNMDGIELCGRLRLMSQIPIIVLSVKGEEKTKVEALDAGADDYVTKPFGIEELLARVRATLRRSPTSSTEDEVVLDIGHFNLDFASSGVLVNGKDIHLTP